MGVTMEECVHLLFHPSPLAFCLYLPTKLGLFLTESWPNGSLRMPSQRISSKVDRKQRSYSQKLTECNTNIIMKTSLSDNLLAPTSFSAGEKVVLFKPPPRNALMIVKGPACTRVMWD